MSFLLRSMMFVPGHNEKLMEKAMFTIADSLILDVEDSVVPDSNKFKARELIIKKSKEGFFKNKQIFIRVNDRESGHMLEDVTKLTLDDIIGFVYPKTKIPEDIYFFDKLLEVIEYERDYEIGKFKIIPLMETTSAILNAKEICKSSDRVIAISFGCEDFIADLCGLHDIEGKSIYVPRAILAMAARATGKIPIDTVNIKVHDLNVLENNIKLSRVLGFEGMLVLHPKELELVHKYYTPSKQEIIDAKKMLELSKEAEKEGKGVAVYNNKFIGPPMVKAAKKLIKRDKLIKDLIEDE